MARTAPEQHRKVTRAFKIEDSLDKSIANRAKKLGITPSSFVSQVLQSYVVWGQYVGPGTSFLTVDKEIFTSLLQEVNEERLLEIARSTALVSTHNYLKFRYQKISLETVLDFLEALSNNSNTAEIRIVTEEDNQRQFEINVRHPFGMKWSLFLAEYISGMFSSFLEMQTTSEISPLGCTIVAIGSKKE